MPEDQYPEMQKVCVAVMFTGSVNVYVPKRLNENDARLLAERLAVAHQNRKPQAQALRDHEEVYGPGSQLSAAEKTELYVDVADGEWSAVPHDIERITAATVAELEAAEEGKNIRERQAAYEYWPELLVKKAAKQGWRLGTPDKETTLEIQRVVPSDRSNDVLFKTDAQAFDYVLGRASVGCPLATLALVLEGQHRYHTRTYVPDTLMHNAINS